MPTTPNDGSRATTVQRRVTAARAAIENLRPHELAAELVGSVDRVVLVDVRSPEEYRSGAIAGAVNVPRGTIEIGVDGVAPTAGRIIVYCDTGARSALTAATLYELGYLDVAHLDGGLAAWRAAGHRVIRSDRDS